MLETSRIQVLLWLSYFFPIPLHYIVIPVLHLFIRIYFCLGRIICPRVVGKKNQHTIDKADNFGLILVLCRVVTFPDLPFNVKIHHICHLCTLRCISIVKCEDMTLRMQWRFLLFKKLSCIYFKSYSKRC